MRCSSHGRVAGGCRSCTQVPSRQRMRPELFYRKIRAEHKAGDYVWFCGGRGGGRMAAGWTGGAGAGDGSGGGGGGGRRLKPRLGGLAAAKSACADLGIRGRRIAVSLFSTF